MKLTTLANVVLSQFVKADAGHAESVHGARLAAVYGAALCIIKDNNGTQFELVKAACEMYTTKKACRELTATPDKDSVAAGRALKVYQAYKLAIDTCGLPAFQKPASTEEARNKTARLELCAPLAEAYALQFVDVLTVALNPELGLSDEERTKLANEKAEKAATKKAEKEKAEQQAALDEINAAKEAGKLDKKLKAEQDAHIKTEASKLAAQMSAPDVDDMAKSVEMAITVGTLDDGAVMALYQAILARMPALAQAEAVPA